ncbi:jg15615 [Pararge aegeria aegeria]|uniref:Jg15615 protein n=1 Tax=Pararge aegeria aegeria TaxID=348720 RepID=A0A8S4RVG2_9NEOP|nr:jg15615 [Pararge aegeria aegeria]
MSEEKGKGPEPVQPVDPESVMRELGHLGRFHLQVYLLIALAAVQVGLVHVTYIFLAADVPYRKTKYPEICARNRIQDLEVRVKTFCKTKNMTNDAKVSSETAGHVDTDALMQELGQFKRFHLLNYFLLGLVPFVLAHYAINYVFLAADVPYR